MDLLGAIKVQDDDNNPGDLLELQVSLQPPAPPPRQQWEQFLRMLTSVFPILKQTPQATALLRELTKAVPVRAANPPGRARSFILHLHKLKSGHKSPDKMNGALPYYRNRIFNPGDVATTQVTCLWHQAELTDRETQTSSCGQTTTQPGNVSYSAPE